MTYYKNIVFSRFSLILMLLCFQNFLSSASYIAPQTKENPNNAPPKSDQSNSSIPRPTHEELLTHGYIVHFGVPTYIHRKDCGCKRFFEDEISKKSYEYLFPTIVDPGCKLAITPNGRLHGPLTYWSFGGCVAAENIYDKFMAIVIKKIDPTKVISMCWGECMLIGEIELSPTDIIFLRTDAIRLNLKDPDSFFKNSNLLRGQPNINELFVSSLILEEPIKRMGIQTIRLATKGNSTRESYISRIRKTIRNKLYEKNAIVGEIDITRWWHHYHKAFVNEKAVGIDFFDPIFREYPHISRGYDQFSENGIGSLFFFLRCLEKDPEQDIFPDEFLETSFAQRFRIKLQNILRQFVLTAPDLSSEARRVLLLYYQNEDNISYRQELAVADKFTIALEAAHILSPEVFDKLQDLLEELPPLHKSIVYIVRQMVKNYLITHCHETTPQLKKDFSILLKKEFNQKTISTIKKRTFQVLTAELEPKQEEISAFFPE